MSCVWSVVQAPDATASKKRKGQEHGRAWNHGSATASSHTTTTKATGEGQRVCSCLRVVGSNTPAPCSLAHHTSLGVAVCERHRHANGHNTAACQGANISSCLNSRLFCHSWWHTDAQHITSSATKSSRTIHTGACQPPMHRSHACSAAGAAADMQLPTAAHGSLFGVGFIRGPPR